MCNNNKLKEYIETNKVAKKIIGNISYRCDLDEDKSIKVFGHVMDSIYVSINDNEKVLTLDFLGTDQLIHIRKTKKIKAKTQQKANEAIGCNYNIPSAFIGAREASIKTGENIRRIYYLISSKKVRTKAFRYGKQVRLFIVKESLYKLYPQIENKKSN